MTNRSLAVLMLLLSANSCLTLALRLIAVLAVGAAAWIVMANRITTPRVMPDTT